MWPVTTLFVAQMKKNLSKTTTTKLFPAKKWETNIRQQYKKTKHLSDYNYSIATVKWKILCLLKIYKIK